MTRKSARAATLVTPAVVLTLFAAFPGSAAAHEADTPQPSNSAVQALVKSVIQGRYDSMDGSASFAMEKVARGSKPAESSLREALASQTASTTQDERYDLGSVTVTVTDEPDAQGRWPVTVSTESTVTGPDGTWPSHEETQRFVEVDATESGWVVSELSTTGQTAAIDEASATQAESVDAGVVTDDTSSGTSQDALAGTDDAHSIFDTNQYGATAQDFSSSYARSRTDAVNYAKAHTYNADYNPNYETFWANGERNDCTNFVSQSLWAGGWKMVRGWYRSNDNWWYDQNGGFRDTFSWSWGGAEPHRQFTRNKSRARLVSSYTQMVPGDVLQIDFGGNGVVDHTAIVVQVTDWNMYVAQHDINDDHRSYRMIRERNPGSRWYLWHYTYG